MPRVEQFIATGRSEPLNAAPADKRGRGRRVSPEDHQARRTLVEWSLESGAWNELSVPQRAILELRYRDDNPPSFAWISGQLGLVAGGSPSATEKVALRSIARAKKSLEETGEMPKTRYYRNPESGGPRGPHIKNDRKDMVEWSLQTGFWNVLSPHQRAVLELRYRDENPLTQAQAAAYIDSKQPGLAVSEKNGFRTLARLKRTKESLGAAKQDGRWVLLSPKQRSVLNSLYGESPKNYKEAAEQLQYSELTITQMERRALKKLASLKEGNPKLKLIEDALESGIWNGLEDLDRYILEQRFGPEGARQEKVADEIGMTRAGVSSRERAALEKIRTLLKAQE